MKKTINFGIDLGTTNSLIAKYQEGKVVLFKNPATLKQTLPSVIAFRKGRIIIGDKAKEVLPRDAKNVIGYFKRKMGTTYKYYVESLDTNLTPITLSSYILKELKHFVHSGEPIQHAVITIPASFDTVQSNATKKAGLEAGFQEVALLQEPIAASLAYANEHGVELDHMNWMVYDLGGGTFDVALVNIQDGEMKVVDHEGNNYLGGADFDLAIIESLIVPHLEQIGQFSDLLSELKSANGKYNRLFNLLLFKAEEAKIALTNSEEAEIEFETEDDAGEVLDVYLVINRAQLQEIIAPFLDQTIEMVQAILDRNGLQTSDIQFMLMIGGSTYIPAIRTGLNQHFGVEINSQIDPTSAVAIGAAYYAGMKLANTKVDRSDPSEKQETNLGSATIHSDLKIETAFAKVSQDRETPFLMRTSGNIGQLYFRILRLDGGFDTGLKPLQPELIEYLTLSPNIYNAFQLKIFDQQNNPVKIETPKIGITHGKFAIDGQPLPNDICLELDSEEDNSTYLEPVFRKNAVLPLKKTIVKQISRNIDKGTDDSLIINILEGDMDNLPAANKNIGFLRISGHDLQRTLIKGSDVEITFEISESRDLDVEVYLTLSDQVYQNVFSPSETHIDLVALNKELEEFEFNIQNKLIQAETNEHFEEAADLSKLKKEVQQLIEVTQKLQGDEVTDEIYQIDETKRQIAKKLHNYYHQSVWKKTLEKYYEAKADTQHDLMFGNSKPEEKQEFESIIKDERTFTTSSNLSVIKMKTTQLKGISNRIGSRYEVTDNDIITWYGYYRKLSFKNQKKANHLFKKGDQALNNNNIPVLTSVVDDLYRLQKKEKDNDEDTFQKPGTGLK